MASRPALESPIVGLPRYPASERSPEEVLRDTDDFFAGQGPVHSTLRRLATRLDREGIPYAIIIASSRSKTYRAEDRFRPVGSAPPAG